MCSLWRTNISHIIEEVSCLHSNKVDYKASFIPCRVHRGHASDKDRLVLSMHEVDAPIQGQVHIHSVCIWSKKEEEVD